MHIYTSKLTSIIGSTAILVVLTSVASAQTFNVVADTFTSYANQTTNYGSNTKINIEGDSTADTKDRVGFFRFDLSAYTGGSISGATFTLYPFEQISSSPQNFDVYGIADGATSENFAEGTLNWSNSGYGYAAGENITDSSNFGDLTYVGSISGVTDADEGSAVGFSAASLDTFLNNDANNIVTFIVVNTNGTGSFNGFYSKENSSSDGSALTIVPEPATATLALGLGMFAVVGLVRRRRS